MKKNEYVSPEMEIVEMTEQCCILAESLGNGNVDSGKDEDRELPPFPGGNN